MTKISRLLIILALLYITTDKFTKFRLWWKEKGKRKVGYALFYDTFYIESLTIYWQQFWTEKKVYPTRPARADGSNACATTTPRNIWYVLVSLLNLISKSSKHLSPISGLPLCLLSPGHPDDGKRADDEDWNWGPFRWEHSAALPSPSEPKFRNHE